MKREVRDTRRLPPEVRERLEKAGVEVPGTPLRDERGRMLVVEARATAGIEYRASAPDVALLPVRGYATRYGASYEIAGGKDSGIGWDETVMVGACAKSVGERDDVRLLFNHDVGPFARTKSGTLSLTSDAIGLLVEAELDLRDSQVRDLAVRMERGDLDQMSFAFQVTRQEWNSDYTERFISECRLFDVSMVTYPASETTSIGIVSDDESDSEPTVEPDGDVPILDSRRAGEVFELERRGIALVDARTLINLAR